jgi:lipopolysaccharide export system permease protein
VKIINKYVLREHVGPLTFALTALTSLLLLNYIAKQFGSLVGKGLPWQVILEFFLLSVPFTVAMTLPMAILVATLYAFSRLASENEITALKASGVSMRRLLLPVIGGGAALAVVMLVFNDQVLPRANHRLRTLQNDIARKKPTFTLREQVINEVSPGKFFLRANHLDTEMSNRMREITIYDLGDPMRRKTIYADSGNMELAPNAKDLFLTLYDGYMQEAPKNEPGQLQRLFYKVDNVIVKGVANQLELSKEDAYKGDREMSVCEMQRELEKHSLDAAVARYNLQDVLLKGVRQATTGAQAVMTVDAPPPSTGLGADAMQAGHTRIPTGFKARPARGLGPAYCAMLRTADKVKLPKFALRSAYAATLPAQDTTKPKKDTTKKDSTKKAAAPTDSGTRRDSSAPPKPAVVQQASQAPTPVPMPVPTPVVPPAGSVQPAVPNVIKPDSARIMTPTLPRPATMPTANPSFTPLNVMTAVAAARARVNDNRLRINRFEVEIQKKFALAVACIVFVLIGAPIALRFPRGGVGLTIGVSLFVFALYYVGLIAGEALADHGYLSPFWAMWGANVVLTSVAAVMLSRMGKEGATARGGDIGEILDALRTWRTNTMARFRMPQAGRRVL